MGNLALNVILVRKIYDGMKSDFRSDSTPFGGGTSGRANTQNASRPWQVSEEEWNAKPEEEKIRLQEQRDEYLVGQRIKNDPLGVAREVLSDAMTPDESTGNTPRDQIRVANETIDDYDRLSGLMLKASHQGQIPGFMNTDPGHRPLHQALADINGNATYESLGVTRDEFLAPLEHAYLAKAEANITIASEMPAGKTHEEAYKHRIEALHQAERSYESVATLHSMSDGGTLGSRAIYKNAVLEENGISQNYFDNLRQQIRADRDAQQPISAVTQEVTNPNPANAVENITTPRPPGT